jgi:hypothetical protein
LRSSIPGCTLVALLLRGTGCGLGKPSVSVHCASPAHHGTLRRRTLAAAEDAHPPGEDGDAACPEDGALPLATRLPETICTPSVANQLPRQRVAPDESDAEGCRVSVSVSSA